LGFDQIIIIINTIIIIIKKKKKFLGLYFAFVF